MLIKAYCGGGSIKSVYYDIRVCNQQAEITMSHDPQKKQDKTKLILAETFAGVITGFCVSPLNTVVDKSVIEYANKKEPTIWTAAGKSMKTLLTKPFTFLKSFQFRWMCFVYLPTFTVSNVADHYNLTDAIPHPLQKLFAVFVTNTVTSLTKDMVFTKRLNPFKPIEPFPPSALGMLFMRDIIAMAGAFTLPAIVAKELSVVTGMQYRHCQRVAQMTVPMLIQIVGTPFHLLGLGYYNQKGKSFAQHVKYMRNIYFSTLAIRMLRVLPAYGIGGICNIELRRWAKNSVPYELPI